MRCINWKVVGGLAMVAAVVAIASPHALGAVVPVLLVLACPLSMVLMARGMVGAARSTTPGRRNDTEDNGELARLRADVADLRARSER